VNRVFNLTIYIDHNEDLKRLLSTSEVKIDLPHPCHAHCNVNKHRKHGSKK